MFENALLSAALRQMLILGIFVGVGFVAAKARVLPTDANKTLSKLETYVFIPALVMGTLMESFTMDKINQAWKLLLFSLAIEVVVLPLSLLFARSCSKDNYDRNVIAYGLAFSNFGFMGNAVVSAVFPSDYFAQYLIFTLPLWVIIYGWAVPAWLIPKEENKSGIAGRLKTVFNPMFVGAIIGIVLGLTGLHTKLPESVGAVFTSIVKTTGDCMSPIAMILTGITVATIDMKKALRAWNIYAVTALRLIVFPLVGLGIFALLPLPEVFTVCAVCTLSMPLGLSPVVIPAGYGKDTSKAAAMTLVSHLASMITIPLLFVLLQKII